MKNVFLDFNFCKSRENGRFLMNNEVVKDGFEIEKQEALKGFKVAQGNLSASAKAHEAQVNFAKHIPGAKIPRKTAETVKTTDKASNTISKSAKLDEANEQDPRKLEREVKEYVSQAFLDDPEFKRVIKSMENEELSQAEQFQLMSNYKELPATKHKFSEHIKLMPKAWKTNVKVAGILGTIGFISHEGGFKDSAEKALEWGVWAAFFTHPMVTGAISHGLQFLGKKIVVPAGGIIFDVVTEFVYEPGKFFDTIKQGKNPIALDKLAGQIQVSQSPLVLRGGKAMDFSPELNSVLDFILANPNPEEIPRNIRDNAAKFMLQTEKVASKTSLEEVAGISKKICNKDKVLDTDFRKVLMWKAREEVSALFAGKPEELSSSVESLREVQAKLSDTDKKKLNELGIDDLDQVVGVGTINLAEITKEKKHGIRRALGNMSGTALITYILIFLMSKGAMWVSGGAKKEVIKKRAGQAGKIAAFIPVTLWKAVTWPVRAINKRYWRGEIGRMGKKPEHGKWNSDQVDLWKELPRKEKNKAVDKLFDKIKDNKKKLREEKKEIKNRLKGRKNKKERKAEITKEEDAAETRAKRLNTKDFNKLFEKVKTKDGKDFTAELEKLK